MKLSSALAVALIVVLSLAVSITLAQSYTFVIEGGSGYITLPSDLVGKKLYVEVVAYPPETVPPPSGLNVEDYAVLGNEDVSGCRIGYDTVILKWNGTAAVGYGEVHPTASSTLPVSAWINYLYWIKWYGEELTVVKSVPASKVVINVLETSPVNQISFYTSRILVDALGSPLAMGVGISRYGVFLIDVEHRVTASTAVSWDAEPEFYARIGSTNLCFTWYDPGLYINNTAISFGWDAVLPYKEGVLVASWWYGSDYNYSLWYFTSENPKGKVVLALPYQQHVHTLSLLDPQTLLVGMAGKTLVIDTTTWNVVATIDGYCLGPAVKLDDGTVIAVAAKANPSNPSTLLFGIVKIDPSTWSVTELEFRPPDYQYFGGWGNLWATGITIKRGHGALLWLYDWPYFQLSIIVIVDTKTGNYQVVSMMGRTFLWAWSSWSAMPVVKGCKVYLPASGTISGLLTINMDALGGIVIDLNNLTVEYLGLSGGARLFIGGYNITYYKGSVTSTLTILEPNEGGTLVCTEAPSMRLVSILTDKGPMRPYYLGLAQYILGAIIETGRGMEKIDLPVPVEVDPTFSVVAVSLSGDMCLMLFNGTYACLEEASRRKVVLEIDAPSGTTSKVILKLPAAPRAVLANGKTLKYDPNLSEPDTWRYDPSTNLLECIVLHHSPVTIEVLLEEEGAEVAATPTISVYRAALYHNTLSLTMISNVAVDVTVYVNGRKFILDVQPGMVAYKLSLYGLKPPYKISVVDPNGIVIYYAVLEPGSKPIVASAVIQPAQQGNSPSIQALLTLAVIVFALCVVCLVIRWKHF